MESYEKRIDIVNDIIEGSHDLLENYRKERDTATVELRESLAKSGSLRRKDFEKMIKRIQDRNEVYEKSVKKDLRHYVKDHHQLAKELRLVISQSIGKKPREKSPVNDFIERLENLKKKQELREIELNQSLSAFQYCQDNYLEIMGTLIEKGSGIRLSDVKQVLDQYSNEMEINIMKNKNPGGYHAN